MKKLNIDGQIYHGSYVIENRKTIVTFYGRTKSGKKNWVIDDFKPYFYFTENDKDDFCIDISKTKKLECAFPFEVIGLRTNKNSYEADIPFTRRVLMDVLESEVYISPKIVYFDLETSRKKDKIISCSAYTNDDKIFYKVGEEADITSEFIKFIKDYDIITSWSDFDKKELDRKNIKLPQDILYLDLLKLFRKLWHHPIQNRKLKTVAKLVNLDKINIYPKLPEDLNESELQVYNMRDSEILKVLDEKLNIIDYFTLLASKVGCEIEDTITSSVVDDILILKECRKQKKTLKTKLYTEKSKKEGYQGAYVFANSGLYEHVIVYDFSSLYPSIIISANISFDTFDINGQVELENGTKFTTDKVGILPLILKRMINERQKLKEQFKLTDDKKYDIQQYGLKTSVINALYGMLGFSGSRIYNPVLAEAVTLVGRNMIKYVKDYLENLGFQVIYGDTDSLFVVTATDIENEINEIIKNYVETQKLVNQFKVEKQDTYDKVYIKKKKNYILFKEPDIYLTKGLGMIRGDTSDFQKELEFMVMKDLLRGVPKKELALKASHMLVDVENQSLDYLGFPKKINLSKTYKVKTMASRAVDYTKKYIGNVEYEDDFKVLPIRRVPQNLPKTDVIALPLDLKTVENFEFDYDTIAQKSISRIKSLITLELSDFFDDTD